MNFKRAMKQLLNLNIGSGSQADVRAAYQQNNTSFMFFSMLPNEILLFVFSFLDVKALGRASRVSHEFSEVAEDPGLWRSLLERKHGKVGLVITKPPKRSAHGKSKKKRSGSFFDDNNITVETSRSPSPPIHSPHNSNNSNNGNSNSNSNSNGNGRTTPTGPSPPSPMHFDPLSLSAPPPVPVVLPELDEMDPANYSAYVKRTIKSVAEDTGSTEYDTWNFKDVCRCCVDYNSIAEAFKHLPSEGKSRILIREGTYKENIKIEFPVEIIGIGKVEKIIVENHNPTNLLTVDTKDSKQSKSFTVIKNLTLNQTGAKPTTTGRASPYFCVLLRSGDVLLEKCVMTSDSCSTVCVQHNKGLAIVRGNVISGSSAGVSVFKCRPDMTIDGNDIHDTGCAGIEIRPGTNPLVVRNKIHNSRSAGVFVFHNASVTSPYHIQGTIIRNEIFENELSGVDIASGARPMLRRNNIRNGKSIGILVHEGGRGVIEKNEIHHNSKCNIFVQQSGSPVIRKNRIHSSGVGFSGIGEGACGEVVSNHIYNHESEGIGLLYKADPIVRNNKIYGNKKAGVIVSHEGRGTFEGNEIFKNAGGGFNIQQRESPIMRDNNVHNNEAIPEDMKRCVENSECTFTQTGYTFRPQAWYYCDTCAPQKDLGCCESCALTCHAGHKLSEKKYSQFFCDCGAEWDCKLVKADRRKVDPALKPNKPTMTNVQSS